MPNVRSTSIYSFHANEQYTFVYISYRCYAMRAVLFFLLLLKMHSNKLFQKFTSSNLRCVLVIVFPLCTCHRAQTNTGKGTYRIKYIRRELVRVGLSFFPFYCCAMPNSTICNNIIINNNNKIPLLFNSIQCFDSHQRNNVRRIILIQNRRTTQFSIHTKLTNANGAKFITAKVSQLELCI